MFNKKIWYWERIQFESYLWRYRWNESSSKLFFSNSICVYRSMSNFYTGWILKWMIKDWVGTGPSFVWTFSAANGTQVGVLGDKRGFRDTLQMGSRDTEDKWGLGKNKGPGTRWSIYRQNHLLKYNNKDHKKKEKMCHFAFSVIGPK